MDVDIFGRRGRSRVRNGDIQKAGDLTHPYLSNMSFVKIDMPQMSLLSVCVLHESV